MVGPWQVEAELGRGGMGTIYAVVHAAIGKRAALKVIHHQALTTDYTPERFLTEARAVNAVPHPNIVDIFETGTLADGRPYLVMERLRGKTLGERQDAGRIPALEVIDYLVPLCDALATAHAAGVVHRDIKLDNIFLVEHSCTQLGAGGGLTVKLLDWGIASMVNVDGERSYSNLMVGTPRYVAPEQARGERVTTASDVYSLGVVAYELFLEEPPFNAPSAAELLVQHLTEAPPMPHEVWPQIPKVLEDLLLSMLAKTPSLRPSVTTVAETLIDLRNELRRAVAVSAQIEVVDETSTRATTAPPAARALTPVSLGHEPTQLPSPPVEMPAMWWQSWRWVAIIAAVAIVLGLRMLVNGDDVASGASAATSASASAATTSAEVAPDPEPLLGPAQATESSLSPSAPPSRSAAAKPVGRHAQPRTAAPTAHASSATEAARKPPRGKKVRLHPDAVIDPY